MVRGGMLKEDVQLERVRKDHGTGEVRHHHRPGDGRGEDRVWTSDLSEESCVSTRSTT